MGKVLDIFIKGAPMPQPRPKAQLIMARGKRPFVKIYTPEVAEAWKQTVRDAVERAWTVYAPHHVTGVRGYGKRKAPLEGPIFIAVAFYFPRPQYMLDKPFEYGRHAIPHGKKTNGDVDNLFKSTTDAMTDAGLWHDDGQIYQADVSKWYCEIGGAPGARVEVETFDDPAPALFDESKAPETLKRY